MLLIGGPSHTTSPSQCLMNGRWLIVSWTVGLETSGAKVSLVFSSTTSGTRVQIQPVSLCNIPVVVRSNKVLLSPLWDVGFSSDNFTVCIIPVGRKTHFPQCTANSEQFKYRSRTAGQVQVHRQKMTLLSFISMINKTD